MFSENKINQSEFLNVSIEIFKNQATEENGLMNIICEKYELEKDSKVFNEILSVLFVHPDLKDTPILVADIPESCADEINAQKNLQTNPDPGFCGDVMAANNAKEMAEIFNQFSQRIGATDQNVICKQSCIYGNAKAFIEDISRNGLELTIGEKNVSIPKNFFINKEKGGFLNPEEAFKKVLDLLQKSEDQGGAELDEANALHVLKQVALAYIGQSGTADGTSLAFTPLNDCSNFGLIPKFGGVKINMKFGTENDQFVLTEKTENSPILGIMNVSMGSNPITSELRLKFPNDSEIRTGLPVKSERKPPTDGATIEWSCPFRENPPRKVIFYGGNQPADTQ
jgi:hypothetical protein